MQQRSLASGAPGLNFIGDLRVNSGLGQAAMALVDAARVADIPLAYCELPLPHANRSLLHQRYGSLPRGTVYSTNLLYYNADPLSKLSPEVIEQALCGKYTAGVWFWELSQMPAWCAQPLRFMDEMWAASRFVRDAVLTLDAQMRVEVIPVPVEVEAPTRVSRSEFGIPEDRYVFLFTFAASSHGERKNPFGVVDAFERAFGHPGDKGPLLVIKARETEHFPEFQTELAAAVERVGGMFIQDDLTRSQMVALLACADAYVSLHRSEGFGLGMAESMCLGKPVIGTAYSGNVDFMTDENSYLVDYGLRRVTTRDHYWFGDDFHQLYEPGMEWAYPSVEHAASYMKRLYDHPEEGRARGAQAADDMRRLCSPAVVGKLMADRLEVIARESRVHRTIHPSDSVASSRMGARSLVARTPVERQRSAWDDWYRIRASGDQVPLGKAPLIGPMLRIIKRIVLLGKLSLAQSELNLETLLTTEALSAQTSARRSLMQDLQTSVDARLAEFSEQLDDAQRVIAQLESAALLNQSRLRLLEQRLEDAGVHVSSSDDDTQQGLPGYDLIALVTHLEQVVPALAQAPTVSLSIQDGQAEADVMALAAHLGNRLDSRNGAITSSAAWYHVDFTPGWNRETLFASAASRLRPDGHLVLVTAPGRRDVDVGAPLTLVFDGEAQTGDVRVQVYVWRLAAAPALERR